MDKKIIKDFKQITKIINNAGYKSLQSVNKELIQIYDTYNTYKD